MGTKTQAPVMEDMLDLVKDAVDLGEIAVCAYDARILPLFLAIKLLSDSDSVTPEKLGVHLSAVHQLAYLGSRLANEAMNDIDVEREKFTHQLHALQGGPR